MKCSLRKFSAFACVVSTLALALATTQASVAAPIQIQVANYNAGMSGAVWAVAVDRGFLKDAGLDVEVRSSGGGSNDIRALIAGELPYVETSVPSIFTAIKQGAELKIVSDNARSFGSTMWFAMADSPVNKLEDIKGRKIGYSAPQSATQMLVYLLIKKLGYSRSDVQAVSAGGLGPSVTLLENRGLDVVTAGNQFFYEAPPGKYKLISSVRDALPPITNVVGVTTPKAMREQGDVIRKLIEARRKAVDFISANPDAAIESMAKVAKWDLEVTRKSVKDLIGHDFWSRGDFGKDDMDNLVAGLREIDVIKGDFDWKPLVDEQFLPADLPRIVRR